MKITHKTPTPLRRSQINAARSEQLETQYHWQGHPFQTDTHSRQQIMNTAVQIMLAQALALPEQPVQYRDANNQNVEFSPQEFLQFAHTLAARGEQIYQASFREKDSL